MVCDSCKQKAYRIIQIDGVDVCENCGGFSAAAGTKIDGSLTRSRIRRESVMHEGDTLPPYSYDKTKREFVPNKEFIKNYPNQAKDYFTNDEMKKHGLSKLAKHSDKLREKSKKIQKENDKVYYGNNES